MKEELYQKLRQYAAQDIYPFHMPGHKRNEARNLLGGGCFSLDITEIDGFDNLHHPENLLRDAQERAAALYQTEESYFSVNGSTAAILAAVSASCRRGGKILIARNCHKAVYHAAYLRGLRVSYVYPAQEPRYGLNGGISPEAVRAALLRDRDIEAVVVTSPTYDGVVSDLSRIADIVHGAGAVLIVDEAHGAHLRFSELFPLSAVECGADLVIQSLHKTLPSLTQTALLHRNSHRVSRESLQRFLGIYQTSSPSYLLMASIDACIAELTAHGEELFSAYGKMLSGARERLSRLSHIRLAGDELKGTAEIFALDPSKLVISVKGCPLRGGEIARILRNKYRIEPEMEAGDYVLALSSVCDTEEGFLRMTDALSKIDASLKTGTPRTVCAEEYAPMEQVLTIAEAVEGRTKRSALALSAGKVSAEFAYLYPPGIPLIVPGERITSKFVSDVFALQRDGRSLQGLSDYSNQSILTAEEK